MSTSSPSPRVVSPEWEPRFAVESGGSSAASPTFSISTSGGNSSEISDACSGCRLAYSWIDGRSPPPEPVQERFEDGSQGIWTGVGAGAGLAGARWSYPGLRGASRQRAQGLLEFLEGADVPLCRGRLAQTVSIRARDSRPSDRHDELRRPLRNPEVRTDDPLALGGKLATRRHTAARCGKSFATNPQGSDNEKGRPAGRPLLKSLICYDLQSAEERT